MNPILYEATEQSFTSNGLGVLSDAITCKVTEERNGAYEIQMRYPISGIHYSEIVLNRILYAPSNQLKDRQPFRIYRITKPLNGMVDIYGQHISYDLSGIPIEPYIAQSVADAMNGLSLHSVVNNPFTFVTTKTTEATMTVSAPCSIRSQLGGKSGSILEVYGGGEYEFDKFQVILRQHRGADRGVSIRYGKNLTALKQEENCAKVYTGVYPYWVDSSTGAVTQLTDKIVNVPGTFNYVKILMLDATSAFSTQPTEAQLLTYTNNYITNNNIGVPEVNLTLSFVQLEQYEEYKGLALLERVLLCDTVHVYFDKLGVEATAKVIKVVYNCLSERVESVEIGETRTKLEDSIISTEAKVDNVPTVGETVSLIKDITSTILGATGGAVRLLDTNDDGVPDTLYIADNANPAQAQKVWRFNYLGWGASTNGYQGPFTMGATLNSGFYADFITAGVLRANLVKIFGTDRFFWDAENISIIDPLNTQRMIRIGQYDGTNYGIGFTTDGGTTWQNCINFSGITYQSDSIPYSAFSRNVRETFSSEYVTRSQYNQEVPSKVDSDYVASQIANSENTTKDYVQDKIDEAKDYTDSVAQPLQELDNDVRNWMQFGQNGLILGQVSASGVSPFRAQLTNEMLAFLQDRDVVSYISNLSMYITKARITEMLSIGHVETGWFDFEMVQEGLSIKWRSRG